MLIFEYAFAAIPMLGILIFVHELGHFVVAKLCGVRVLKFSLGFGPPIGFGDHRLRWVRGGTEYVVAWVPLGGFVRMLGEQMPGDAESPVEIPDDARPDEYLDAKPTWQKIAIVLAGPGMNLALPILLFMVMLWAGIPKPASVVGMVEVDSPAAEVGLLPGDRIVAIDGEPVEWWEQVVDGIRTGGGRDLAVTIERESERLEVTLPLGSRTALDDFGDAEEVGWGGIGHERLPALIAVQAVDSPAALAGLRSGDRIIRVGGVEAEDWEQLAQAYSSAASDPVEIELARGLEADAPHRTLNVPALGSLAALGVVSAPILVGSVVEGMPAARAGLLAGDLIVAVDGLPVGSFRLFADTIRASGGRALEISFVREGVVQSASIQPIEREVPGPFGIDGMEEKVFQVGIAHALATLPGVTGLDRERDPVTSFRRALGMTVRNASLIVRGFGKLVTGQVGADQLRGPITIVQIARESLDRGWQVYLGMMMFISINLGILNLLPIPILDGGQLVIFSIEGIKRSPLSLRTREFVQQIGFVVLMLLMGLAFWNDLSGQWSKLVEWLSTES
jgi:regulator of sigma E protease